MISLTYMEYKKTDLIETESRLAIARAEDGVGRNGCDGQRKKTYTDKINKLSAVEYCMDNVRGFTKPANILNFWPPELYFKCFSKNDNY